MDIILALATFSRKSKSVITRKWIWSSPKSVDKYDVKTEMEKRKCSDQTKLKSSKNEIALGPVVYTVG